MATTVTRVTVFQIAAWHSTLTSTAHGATIADRGIMANQNAILIDVEPDAIELTINDLDAVNGGAGALSTLLTILMGMRHDELKTIQNNLRS